MIWTVYAIRDPRTSQVVYVGQTKNFAKRQKAHLRCQRKPRVRIKTTNIKTWLYDLGQVHLLPVFERLGEYPTEQESLDQETRWVQHFRSKGHPLLNRWRIHSGF